MPVQKSEELGFVLHPVDLAINKLLALVGRDEARDFLDVIYANESLLPLGAMCWAACGKDPGFSPSSLMSLLKRRGKYREEDFERLHLKHKVNLQDLKQKWLLALEEAEIFIIQAPPEHLGCLFFSTTQKKFIAPDFSLSRDSDLRIHKGRLGGVWPEFS